MSVCGTGPLIVHGRIFLEPLPRASGSYRPRPCGTATTGRPTHFRGPSRRFNRTTGCRNINLLSIDYAFRPRLRSRLTLGGFTFPRKPWAFGEQDFHLFYRYLSQHKHFLTLHDASPRRFAADRNAPLPLQIQSAASVLTLFPIIIGAKFLDQ